MIPSKGLFSLIKSLSGSEKRYFKIYASLQAGNKNYIKLFDAIEGMDEYDESLIKKTFEKNKFTRQLTFTKNYLSKQIFKSLYSYNSGNTIEIKLNDLMFRCSYFYKNALYDNFIKTVRAGKRMSLEYERFGYFIQFSSYEKILMSEKFSPDVNEKSILVEEELVSEKINNLHVYDSFVEMLNGIYREEGRIRDNVLFKYIERIKQSPLLTTENFAVSALARERFYYLLQLISDIFGDFDAVYSNCKKRLKVLIDSPKPFTGCIYNYWQDILMNLILHSIRLNKPKKMISYLHMLEEHQSDDVSSRINQFLVQSILSMQLLITEKRWDKVNWVTEAVELGLSKYSGRLDSNFEIIVYDLIVRLNFESGQYKKSLIYINRLLGHTFISLRRDIEYNARLLNVIIHYELGNLDYLEYLILSTYRFLYKRKKIFMLETYVLNFMKRLFRSSSDDDLVVNFKILQKDLKTIRHKLREKNIFYYFDYLSWVNNKIKELQSKN